MKALKFSNFIKESFGDSSEEYGTFFVRLLGLRDQAHVFHWQTESHAEHMAFGDFYETFIGLTDTLAEMLMGLHGRPTFGEATINLSDYSEGSIAEFLENSYDLLGPNLQVVCDEEKHPEVFDHARVIISELDKLKYLLTLK